MGVPAFFRWLCARNPQFILDVQENYENFDEESLNPEIDNLYLDMNGIIHPCCRSDGSVVPIPHSIQDMFNNIFLYIDKLVDLIRPKKILYMAIDGVAPRAKMNQQRARRFKGAKEAVDLQLRKEELLKEFTSKNEINDDVLAFVQHRFDTNVITPGTCFMRDLSNALQHYVLDRVNNHPLFKNLKIIFSDAGIPGEGEHKILDFIRVQRNSENYDPNTKHCLYGADADLIMLGLSTHEPYFYIIREQIVTQEEKRCSICQQSGHFMMDCPNELRVEVGEKNIPVSVQKAQETKIRKGVLQSFQFAKLYVMRQYLNMRFSKFFFNENLEQVLKMPYDIEKIIDDFVFMCFFVGNDFLPHIPNLSIRDGGIDALITIYEHTLTQVDDYLTNNGELNLKQVAKFIENMAIVEEQLMKFRRDKEERDKKNQINNQEKEIKLKQLKPHLTDEEYLRKRKEWRLKDEKKVDIVNNETLIMRFKRVLQEQQDESKTIKEIKESSAVTLNYNYKLAYYNDKFDVKPKDFVQMQQLIKQSYIEALCWNFAYYYKGCISWGWYYPFHYSPFASDLLDIDQHIIQFDKGQPFKPFQQLLSVFPPASALSVPQCYQHLMVNPESEIADFYPSDFYVDLIGKKYEWLGEVILPFIEEERLVVASEKYEHQLSAEEQQRNSVSKLLLFYNQEVFKNMPVNLTQEECQLIGVMEDTPKYALNKGIQLLDPSLNIRRVTQNNVVCKPIVLPEFTRHDIQLLQGLIEPKEEISDSYLQKTDMRTYQGENTIRLIKGILSGKDNETTWQKGFQGRINYNSGQGDYGNMLNIREMMKHQDQMSSGQQQQQQQQQQQYQKDFRGGSNYNNNNNYSTQNQYQQVDDANHNVFNPLMDDRQNNKFGRQNNNQYNSNQTGQQQGRGNQGNYSRQGNNNNNQYYVKNGGRFGSGQNYQQSSQQYQPQTKPYNSSNQYQSRNNNNNNDYYQQNNRRGYQQGSQAVDLKAVGQIRAQHVFAQQNAPQVASNAIPDNLPQNNQYRDNPNQYFVPSSQAEQKIQAPSYLNTFTYNSNAQKSDKTKKIYEPSVQSNDIDIEEYDPIEAIRKQFKKE